MKEKAEKCFLEYYPPKMHLTRDKHDRELQVFSLDQMLDFATVFAQQEVNNALQEAAKIQDHLRCEHFDDPNEDEIVYNAILSLQIKDNQK